MNKKRTTFKSCKPLLPLFLCVLSVLPLRGQVVYGYDEQSYVKSGPSAASPVGTSYHSHGYYTVATGYNPSRAGENWFFSIRGGMNAFVGSPKGCGDFFDRTKPLLDLSAGKWHTPYVGNRISFQGFTFKDGTLSSSSFQSVHLDFLYNVSAYLKENLEHQPCWTAAPYVGTGLVRNSTARRSHIAVSYGFILACKFTSNVLLSADIGATSTFQDFDGTGKAHHFGDNFLNASLGVTVNLGKTGFTKSSRTYATDTYPDRTETADGVKYPRNDYSGLNSLRNRLGRGYGGGSDSSVTIGVPIYFFFKINTTKLIATSQRISYADIAAYVSTHDCALKIEGASDSRTGNKKLNRSLSIRRARYIARQLMKAGVPKERMRGYSRGGINEYSPYPANRQTCVTIISTSETNH